MNYQQMKKWVTKKSKNQLVLMSDARFQKTGESKYSLCWSSHFGVYKEANSYEEIKEIINFYLENGY